MAPLLLLLLLPSCSWGFRFSVSRTSSGQEEDEGLMEGDVGVSDVLVGLFDTVQGLTRGVAGLVGYYGS